ncbi:MAG TPA: glutathione synthase [Propionibacteriaceae bacterium]|nr:glutathione synthase [Propionibacteriaceae bacterium]
MRLAFFVNDVDTEIDEYTTTRLARAAAQAGHEVWYIGVGDVEHGDRDGQLVARAHAAEFDKDDTLASYMQRIKERDAERIVMDDLDALFLRNDSIEDLQERPWASPLGGVFGQMLKARGVAVVNDPMSLMRATSKLYLEEFPEKIRPRSLVTRDPEAIKRFVGTVGHCVVKPLYGAKGRNVFMIQDDGETNLAQMTEAVLQDGYAIAQEFVDGGEDGDARIFLLEGQILERNGKLAAFRRVPTGDDPRANISVGGCPVPLQVGDVERGIIEAMSTKLLADGMYFVGIDVIGDKVVEINAESPGGMQSVERLYEIDVCPTVIETLERRTSSTS